MVVELNEMNFNEKVLDVSGKVLVEFFATWCPHCQRMAPIIDELAEDEKGRVEVYRVDVDKSPNLADKYAPHGFPTFGLFEGGQVVNNITGETTIDSLKRILA